jgi:hypothetical protein
MRELTKQDRPAFKALIADFEKKFGVKCDPLNAYIWLRNYEAEEIRAAFEITAKWRERKRKKNEEPTDADLNKYSTSVMRNRAQARNAVAELFGEEGAS